MSLLSVVQALKDTVDPLALYFSGDEVDSEDSAIGILHFAGETPVNECYDPRGYTLWQIAITSCNLKDILEYWCQLKPLLLKVKRLHDVQTLNGDGYKVGDDEYEMIIKFKIRN